MQQALTFHSGVGDAGLRLDVFLAARLEQLSRMGIAHLIAAGACTVNGDAATAGQLVRGGDVIALLMAETVPNAMTPEALPLQIIYEDAELMVVDKQAGLLVHPTRGIKTGTLANGLVYHLNRLRLASNNQTEPPSSPTSNSPIAKPTPPAFVRPGIVHRLDRATSGLMVVAKTQRALGILTRHFHERRVKKSYLALVRGRVGADEFAIDAPIGRVGAERPHWRVAAAGKPAQTHLRVLKRAGGVTLAELEPLTGRTNQLRIHCAHAGHAIVGDEWYDEASIGATNGVHRRLCLHAARLAFNHPTGGAWLEFVAPLPEEMQALGADCGMLFADGGLIK